MKTPSPIKLTLAFTDPELDDRERDREVQTLLTELKGLDLIRAGRAPDPAPPEGNKAMGGVLTGMIIMELYGPQLKNLFGLLGARLSGKTIEFEVEANGKRLSVKAADEKDMDLAIRKARAFIEE
uniref:Uncharacterized protein n=1 Tax=Candidatus Kentrum sp. FM TaxID=2126340 RepID=A0A450U1S1_9GAMM|nr:MAG: hypothetical protein BECKFM1743A_GA0114220_109171 [Candidatus Kentron sp. FM]VFJ76443.1 MAG: hypothetical protein BECKFM1743C_GA0114222_109303 [Candidatus Kentron sp. FM]VFK23089.1 MAG: hypothetical protein BECKFM1743B_GA0114221_109011 [Candidatus Kentron sp. FM]